MQLYIIVRVVRSCNKKLFTDLEYAYMAYAFSQCFVLFADWR